MSGRFSRRWRVALVVVAFFGAVVSMAWAAESTAPDGLEKVRRELEAVKAARDPATPPARGLPASAMPDWQGGTTPPPASGAALKLPSRETKSTNWLIEAMNRQPNSRTPTEPAARPREGDSPLAVTESKSGTRGTSEAEAAAASAARDTKPAPGQQAAPDPFARFLGEWMTPRDYALLKTPAWNEFGPRDDVRELNAATSRRDGAAPDLSASLAAIAGNGPAQKTAAAPAVPRENPYLQSLAAPSTAVSLASVAPKPVVSSIPRGAFAPSSLGTAPVVPAQPKAPDFAKPTDDEKYFKQLKRF